MNKKHKTISVIVTIIVGVIATLMYNFSFKYDKTDSFFKAIIIRSEQLSDKYVYDKFVRAITNLNTPINSSLSQKFEIYSRINKSNFTTEYFKTLLPGVKPCNNCFASRYTDLYNRDFKEHTGKGYWSFTYGGMPYSVKVLSTNCRGEISGANTNCGIGYVDINGKRGPNQLGVDLLDMGLYYFPGSKKNRGVKENSQIVSFTFLYANEFAINYCLTGRGDGCSWVVTNRFSRNTYLLNKTPIIRSKYSFDSSYNHIYITPKGKIVFFNNSGFVDFVTVKGLLENIQLYRRYLVWKFFKQPSIELAQKKQGYAETYNYRKTEFYKKHPKLKPKPKKQKIVPITHYVRIGDKVYGFGWKTWD